MKLSLFSMALAIGAVLLALFRPVGSPETARSAAAVPAGDEPLAERLDDLREATAALGERLDRLEMRQRVLESRPPSAPEPAARQPAEPVVEDEPDPAERKLRELLAVLENPELAPASDFEALVLNVIEAKERAEEARREARRQELLEARVSERVAELTEALGLTLEQSKGLHRVLTEAQLRREELASSMREEGAFDRDLMRETMRDVAEGSRNELQTLLTSQQYGELVELEGGERRFLGSTLFGGGGPPGPAGPPPGLGGSGFGGPGFGDR